VLHAKDEGICVKAEAVLSLQCLHRSLRCVEAEARSCIKAEGGGEGKGGGDCVKTEDDSCGLER